jgi:hypothetical protein
LCARRDVDGFAVETGTTTYSAHVTRETNRTRPSRLETYLIDARWNLLGFGTWGALLSAHNVATVEYLFRGWVALLCLNALLVLGGACGLVLRRRSANSTVYATENGVHDPQDTGNDQ